ncbi:Sulfate transporter/antisigma-factor antagonist STAS [Gammaproteobacteria bacterium]
MTNSGFILHAERDHAHFLRLVGAIRYPLAPSLDAFLQKLFAAITPRAFLVDLSATELIDSTNLGLLVKIARFMAERHAPLAVLFSPREDITAVLISMGFDQFFNLITTDAIVEVESTTCEPIPRAEVTQADLARTILEAHRDLINMDARNEAAFRDVVRYLEQEVNHPPTIRSGGT